MRSDIYSLGCVLYELLEGKPLFFGDSGLERLRAAAQRKESRPLFSRPDRDPTLVEIANKCLAVEAARRYASMEEILQRLDGGSSDLGISEADPAVAELSAFSKSSVVLAVLGATAAVIVLVAGAQAIGARDIRVEFSRDAARTRAREVVTALGYPPGGLVSRVELTTTDFDVGELMSTRGAEAAREAIRQGEVYWWRVDFTKSGRRDAEEQPGDLQLEMDTLGKLRRFETPPSRDEGTRAVESDEALAIARKAAGSWLGVETGGWEEEVAPRISAPGLVQVSWRNPSPVFDRTEMIQVDLQEKRVVRLARSLEPRAPPAPERVARAGTIDTARAALLVGPFGIADGQRRDAEIPEGHQPLLEDLPHAPLTNFETKYEMEGRSRHRGSRRRRPESKPA